MVPSFIWVRDLGNFVCIVRKINNILLCIKIMLICCMHEDIASSRVCVHGIGYSPFLVNV